MKKLMRAAVLLAAWAVLLAMSAAAADIGTGTIQVNTYLRVREAPSTSAAVLGKLAAGTEVKIQGVEDEWYVITLADQTGYIHSDYVEFTPAEEGEDGAEAVPQAETPEEQQAEEGKTEAPCVQQQIVDTACLYLGCRYRYGGSSPETGFDCSGFTSYVYAQFGVSLERTASGQLNDGPAVAKEDLQMGDLVLFRDTRVSSKGASHVGIYIGNNKFVHASSSRTGYVLINELSESYWSGHYVGARRPLAG